MRTKEQKQHQNRFRLSRPNNLRKEHNNQPNATTTNYDKETKREDRHRGTQTDKNAATHTNYQHGNNQTVEQRARTSYNRNKHK